VATRMERRLMFGSAQRSLKQATVMERRLTRREGRWVRLEEVDGWWNGTAPLVAKLNTWSGLLNPNWFRV